MSRSIDRGDGELLRQQQDNLNQTSVSRGGSSNTESEERRDEFDRRSDRRNASDFVRELSGLIDQAAANRPTMTEFIGRLEKSGVNVVPSIQSSGRLNGMSYGFKSILVKGSRLGRAYTAQGLQARKGVQYDPGRDDAALRQSLENAGVRHAESLDSRFQVGRNPEPDRDGRIRDRVTGLNSDQKATLAEIGRFRTVKTDDLVQYRYAGNYGRFQQDMRVLSERGLAERRSVQHLKSGREYSVVVLTQRGRNDVRRMHAVRLEGEPRQQFHAGFVKPAEVRHDIGIYRMYQAEKTQIERDGGTVTRVVLDFELKKEVFAKLNRGSDRSDPAYPARKKEIAEEHGLKVIDGRLVFPDLRIEYERADQQIDKVDLELATGDYKNSQVQAKHAAGLKIYAPDSAAGSPALQDLEIIAGLISI